MEKQFRWITDKVKLWDVPIGKSLLLLLFMGIPGKFIARMVRHLMVGVLDATDPDYYKKVDMYSQLLTTGLGFGAALGVKKGLKGVLGETGSEAMALGTLTGALDAGFNRVGANVNRDLSDLIGHETADKLDYIIYRIKGTPVATAGPGKAKALGLAGFPEAGSSAWREQQRWLASSEAPKARETAGPRETIVRREPVSSEAPVDPIQRMEEILVAKSKL